MLNGSTTRPALAGEIACDFSGAYRPRRGNAATEEPLSPEARAEMIGQAARKIEELFDILLIDHSADPNTRDTPRRVATAFVEELLSGRYTPPPRVTQFDDVHSSDELIVTGPIEVRSMCAHHLMPIYGHAVIGILPDADGRLVGLSKYDRIVDHFARRLQSQEELVRQIGDFIVEKTRPRGLIIRMSAVHMCKTHRGVHASHSGRMVNFYSYGELESDGAARRAFLSECTGMEAGLTAGELLRGGLSLR
ncbi:MAG TPA: GTP cyclohydrolase I [Afifellaceae bacterium]|nr:GTP cyclohydrolase I [Afifellaceae bacterium]